MHTLDSFFTLVDNFQSCGIHKNKSKGLQNGLNDIKTTLKNTKSYMLNDLCHANNKSESMDEELVSAVEKLGELIASLNRSIITQLNYSKKTVGSTGYNGGNVGGTAYGGSTASSGRISRSTSSDHLLQGVALGAAAATSENTETDGRLALVAPGTVIPYYIYW
jgi:hypothetical protein